MDNECAKVDWKKPKLQAAGVLDRVLGHRRKQDEDGDDSEYEDGDNHSTCNNGDDSDPGTNWQAYGKRSLIEDSSREIALADGSDVNVGDSISLRDRLLIHGAQAGDGAHLVVTPDHHHEAISRRDDTEAESTEQKDEQSAPTEQCDYDDARKQIAQELVHAADSAFANAPKKSIEHFFENVLAGIARPRNSRKHSQEAADHSEPVDNAEELNETTDSHGEHDTSYQDNEHETEDDDRSTVVSIVYVTESPTSSVQILQTPSIPLLTLPTTTSDSTSLISPASSAVEESSSDISSLTTVAPGSSSETSLELAVTTIVTVSVTEPEPSTTLIEASHSSVPIVEPPSLTVARAFSLADELALKEEMDAQAAKDQAQQEVDGNSELDLASSFASKYLEMTSAKATSSVARANGSLPEAKVSAWGTGENHYIGDHMRAGDGSSSPSNATSNSTLNSTFSATSQKGTKSGAMLNTVSVLALTIGLFLATTL